MFLYCGIFLCHSGVDSPFQRRLPLSLQHSSCPLLSASSVTDTLGPSQVRLSETLWSGGGETGRRSSGIHEKWFVLFHFVLFEIGSHYVALTGLEHSM